MSYVVQVAEAKPARGKSLAVGPEYRYDDFETFGRARGGKRCRFGCPVQDG